MASTNSNICKTFDIISIVLLIVGGLNWGLVGLFGFDLVAFVFGPMSILGRVVYGLVGLSALYQAVSFKSIQQRWECGRLSPSSS